MRMRKPETSLRYLDAQHTILRIEVEVLQHGLNHIAAELRISYLPFGIVIAQLITPITPSH